ncbi:MAG: hypothetical protein JRI97_11390 [Deltaproteobacteria bacterium]|nr:hypothetical protein [Deltaproteobacteria bacterium]
MAQQHHEDTKEGSGRFLRRVGLAVFLVFLVAVGVQLFLRATPVPQATRASGGASLEDVRQMKKHVRFLPSPAAEPAGEGEEDVMDMRDRYADHMILDTYTLKYFRHLARMFADARGRADHLDQVRAFLEENFPAEDAAAIYELYEKYLQTEMELAEAQKQWDIPRSPEEVVAMLERCHTFRQERLGEEIADALYGAELKARIYATRRGAIVADKDLYGEQKEALIRELNEKTWDEPHQEVESIPTAYNRYREKLAMYERDIKEAPSGQAREEMVQDFRKEFFAPEVVQRMEEVDRAMAEEREKARRYREQEAKIRENEELSPKEKQERITDLQDRTFEDPEAFRRLEAMRRELEERKRQYQERR